MTRPNSASSSIFIHEGDGEEALHRPGEDSRRFGDIVGVAPVMGPGTAPGGAGGDDGCGPASPCVRKPWGSKREYREGSRAPARKPQIPLPCLTGLSRLACPSLPQQPRYPTMSTGFEMMTVCGLYHSVIVPVITDRPIPHYEEWLEPFAICIALFKSGKCESESISPDAS